MPPKHTYTFKHKTSEIIRPISIEIYGDKYTAWGLLGNFVSHVNDWELI